MKKVKLPANFEEAVERVRATKRVTEGFAFFGERLNKYLVYLLIFLISRGCDRHSVQRND
jgi:hypothetical protein